MDNYKSIILCFVLIMSILNVIKELARFYFAFKEGSKYESMSARTIMTMMSLSYIITIMIYGL